MRAGFGRIPDVHNPIQPWRGLKPAVLDVMWRGAAAAQRDRMIQLMEDPRALLEVMDGAGVWRAGPGDHASPGHPGVPDPPQPLRAPDAPPELPHVVPVCAGSPA